jgi:hypothetical protein
MKGGEGGGGEERTAGEAGTITAAEIFAKGSAKLKYLEFLKKVSPSSFLSLSLSLSPHSFNSLSPCPSSFLPYSLPSSFPSFLPRRRSWMD